MGIPLQGNKSWFSPLQQHHRPRAKANSRRAKPRQLSWAKRTTPYSHIGNSSSSRTLKTALRSLMPITALMTPRLSAISPYASSKLIGQVSDGKKSEGWCWLEKKRSTGWMGEDCSLGEDHSHDVVILAGIWLQEP